MKRLCIAIVMLLCLFLSCISVSALDKNFIYESLNIKSMPLDVNYSVATKISPKYIVIHEINNVEDYNSAQDIYSLWNKDKTIETSSHFIVDSENILQLLDLDSKAWHIKDNQNYPQITDNNSISIVIFSNNDLNYIKARAMAIRLTRYLMQELSIDIEHVISYSDIVRESDDEAVRFEELWDSFKNEISKPDKIIDGIYLNIEKSEYEIDNHLYLASNSLIESKLIFKKYNVSSFAWNLFKNYSTAPSFELIEFPVKRVINNISDSDYSIDLSLFMINDMYKAIKSSTLS